jgi:hypothetical protein
MKPAGSKSLSDMKFNFRTTISQILYASKHDTTATSGQTTHYYEDYGMGEYSARKFSSKLILMVFIPVT